MNTPNSSFSKTKLTTREEDYSQWYLDVAKAGEMFDYAPTPGCIIFLPKAVSIWERIKQEVNEKIQPLGVQNLYLPMLIPMSFFEREKEHVEWFAPELAVVTHAWWKELDEKLAIRPTSETMFCSFFKDNLQSYRDLPLLYNQWVSVLRWEKRTRPFLRTSEFYWQEWHTLHETSMEAKEFAEKIMHDVYIRIFREIMAIDGISGVKSTSEKFAWAETTYTFEPMMSNGWALQICTSHILGKWFMEQFDVSFLWRDGSIDFPAYTSWWMSTRSIGWIISSHSDNKGLIIPPNLAEYRAVILPVYRQSNKDGIDAYAKKISSIIVGEWSEAPVKWTSFRSVMTKSWKTLLDYRDVRFGEKIKDFELSGYPVAIVVGEQECANNICTIISRISWEKIQVPLTEVNSTIERLFQEGQKELFLRSQQRLRDNTVPCDSMEDIWKAIWDWKFALYEWDLDPNFEIEIKEKFKATTRCIPNSWQFTDQIMKPKNPNNVIVLIARAF